MKPLHQILKKPLVTEKSSSLQTGEEQVVAFEVSRDANKIEIKQAVESAFDVKVKDIRTMIVRGKVKRVGRSFGQRQNRKKAYVTLEKNNTIDFFGV